LKKHFSGFDIKLACVATFLIISHFPIVVPSSG
jgi:hypothetical protein